jgi:HAD superfamily hydrolase (TIGR01509 family)
MELIEAGSLPLRPGVARLVDEAIAANLRLAVCSTSNERAVTALVKVMLGEDRARHIAIFAGDVVAAKKPDPAIYNLAARTLALDPGRCVVVEDSHIGLTAAKAAGMSCIVTRSAFTAEEDFRLADIVVPDLEVGIGLTQCRALVARSV